jgi:hypothetical protein
LPVEEVEEAQDLQNPLVPLLTRAQESDRVRHEMPLRIKLTKVAGTRQTQMNRVVVRTVGPACQSITTCVQMRVRLQL